MNKEVKRRKFHEALLNIFYPNTQQPPYQKDVDEEESAAIVNEDHSNMDHITDFVDNLEEKTPSDTSECAPQKLTRAQRKKLRRKMLKKTASCRRKIIGPLLPSMDSGDVIKDDEPPSLHEMPIFEAISTNGQGLDGSIVKPGERHVCIAQNKLKHRRLAKRLSRNTVD